MKDTELYACQCCGCAPEVCGCTISRCPKCGKCRKHDKRDTEWLKEMADKEDGSCVSVGGLAVDLGLYKSPEEK